MSATRRSPADGELGPRTRPPLSRRTILTSGVALGLAAALTEPAAGAPRFSPYDFGFWKYLRGVNVAGAEFGDSPAQLPGTYGTDYAYERPPLFQYLADRGHKVVRVPIRWERIQHKLLEPLDAAEVVRLKSTIDAARAARLAVILDLHNYGKFTSSDNRVLALGNGISRSAFADVWTRIVGELDTLPNIAGWGLMNEPNGLGGKRIGHTPFAVRRRRLEVGDIVADPAAWRIGAAAGGPSAKITRRGARATTRRTITIRRSTHPDAYSTVLRVRVDSRQSGGVTVTAQRNPLYPDGLTAESITVYPGQTFDLELRPHWSDPPEARHTTRALFTVGRGQSCTVEIFDKRLMDGNSTWKRYSRTAVAAIRRAGSARAVLVAGDDFSTTSAWTATNGQPWINDGNCLYEAHYYFDAHHSGIYAESFRSLTARARASGQLSVERRISADLADYLDWLHKFGVRGFIGELGWPTHARDHDDFDRAGDHVYQLLDRAGVGATLWSAGSRWGNSYPLQAYWQRRTGVYLPTPGARIAEHHKSVAAL